MKKTVFILLGVVVFLFSCKKEPHNQFSHWYVGNDSFASNNVEVTIYVAHNSADADIRCNNNSNFFEFNFPNNNYLPNSGTYYLTDSPTYNPTITDRAVPTFGYNGKFYTVPPSSGSSLYATQVNGKSAFRMDSTMFYNTDNPNDSVVIHGIFSQP